MCEEIQLLITSDKTMSKLSRFQSCSAVLKNLPGLISHAMY